METSIDRLMPVILGGDIGAYSLARAAHEAYGVKSLVISQTKSHLINDSSILVNRVVADLDDAAVFRDVLSAVAHEFAGRALLLLACSDWYVSLITDNRDALEGHFVIPYAPAPVLAKLTNKESFYDLCGRLDIPHPATASVDFAGASFAGIKELILDADLGFPLIAKPENSGIYHYADFPGKRKVFLLDDEAALDDFIGRILGARYAGKFLMQRYIPGDDTAMRILTTYSDRSGNVRFFATGQTLLEDHRPLAIGNPVAIRTLKNDRIVQDARRLLEHSGYTGFANFDIKVDPVTHQHYFFELNARLGRSNWYVTSRGHNVVSRIAEDLLSRGGEKGRTVAKASTGDYDPAEIVSADETDVLYSLIPKETLLKNISSPLLRKTVECYYAKGAVSNPIANPHEGWTRRVVYPMVFGMRQRQAFSEAAVS